MIRTLLFAAALAVGFGAAASAQEEEVPEEEAKEEAAHSEGGHTTDYSFSFEGPFGTYDQAQLQRGLQVYTEICSGCHGLRYVAFRTLADAGGPALSDEQMRLYTEQWEVVDEDTGETRPATPTDHYPESTVENAPDLSLMGKARAGFHGPYGLGINQVLRGTGGAEYIASFLVGFTGEEREEAGVLLYENAAKGAYVQMAPVLYGDDVVYEDGAEATPEQIARDVAAFLMWTAEPKMMARKQAGMTAVLFLAGLTVLLYYTNKQIWAPHKGGSKQA